MHEGPSTFSSEEFILFPNVTKHPMEKHEKGTEGKASRARLMNSSCVYSDDVIQSVIISGAPLAYTSARMGQRLPPFPCDAGIITRIQSELVSAYASPGSANIARHFLASPESACVCLCHRCLHFH